MIETVRKESQTRHRLLKAASQIVNEGGLRGLTLDLVAQKAQVSKGGLLYHFPSKDALMQGLVEHLIALFMERLQSELNLSNEPEGTPGRWLRAYLRATFATDDLEYELSAALAVAIAEQPALLGILRTSFDAFASDVEEDGVPVERATMVRLAADGLWFGEALQLVRLKGDQRKAFLAYLISLTYANAQV